MSDRTNVYEAMIIFDANRFARERAALPAEIEKTVQAEQGEVVVSRLWEERRLAYPINGQRKGTYWLIYFRGPTASLTSLNRQAVERSFDRRLSVYLRTLVAEVAAPEEGGERPPQSLGEPLFELPLSGW